MSCKIKQCLTFKKFCLLNLLIFHITCNAVHHLSSYKRKPVGKYPTDCLLSPSDTAVMKSQLVLRIKLATKHSFWIFHTLKIRKMMPFCNLFMEQRLYYTGPMLTIISMLLLMTVLDDGMTIVQGQPNSQGKTRHFIEIFSRNMANFTENVTATKSWIQLDPIST